MEQATSRRTALQSAHAHRHAALPPSASGSPAGRISQGHHTIIAPAPSSTARA
jgi:hypothetical protein